MTLLTVENLDLKFDTDEGRITAVDNVSFELNSGEVLGLVGVWRYGLLVGSPC